ncbi:MAG TPA: carboxypeptidase regulatory-like domain-containing protein [Candidatus Acidoferrales bacterium]|nr:carboxypeptidase regulatory-like domain-containing protein [Candidatus Acidoferrales bacterium]
MKTRMLQFGALILFLIPLLLWAPRAVAQNGQLSGQVFDTQGKPYPDVVVTITSTDTGTAYTVKTDKDGKFLQLGMQFGNYKANFKKDNINYDLAGIKIPDQSTPLVVNFKEIAAKQGVDPEAAAKAETAKKKFTDMKAHFDSGRAALTASDALRQQIGGASGDQLADLLAKRNASLTTAISEFQQAQQAAAEKDPNLPTVLGNLGLAYDGAGEVDRMMMRHAPADQHETLQTKMNSDYGQAVANLQKAADIKPTAAVYFQLGTELANTGKIPEASAACDKGAALDPTNPGSAENCYRNIGIVLSNQNKMQDAVAPLQKATQMNPKDAEAWFLLGSALTNTIATKQEGGKMIYIIPPGTAEAYQKYLELEPNGPHAADAKGSLDAIQQMGGGLSTKVNTRKKN